MHCPKCGTEATDKPKFCRVCGQDLAAVAALLSGQPATGSLKRWPMFWGTGLIVAGAAFGSVLKVLSKQGINPAGEITPYLLSLGILTFFAGLTLVSYWAVSLMFPHNQMPHSPAQTAHTARMQPELLDEEMPSITEKTTELFDGDGARVPVRTTAPRDE